MAESHVMSIPLITIIMAGGLGKRMNSTIPKVLHLVNGEPMICHVIRQSFNIHSNYILIVVGKFKEEIQNEIQKYFSKEDYLKLNFIDQIEPKGTGHAIHCCLDFLTSQNISNESNVLILSGDVPLIKEETIQNLLTLQNTLLITELENPYGCGRIIFSDNENYIKKIVEEKDCNKEEREIKYVNCGIYNFSLIILKKYIPLIQNNNANQEFYLTDIVELLEKENILLNYCNLPKSKKNEIVNINTQDELRFVNSIFISE